MGLKNASTKASPRNSSAVASSFLHRIRRHSPRHETAREGAWSAFAKSFFSPRLLELLAFGESGGEDETRDEGAENDWKLKTRVADIAAEGTASAEEACGIATFIIFFGVYENFPDTESVLPLEVCRRKGRRCASLGHIVCIFLFSCLRAQQTTQPPAE